MQLMLQVFEYENNRQFRILDHNGEPWFILADVCRELDIKNPSDAAARLDADEKMTLDLTEGQSGVRGGARKMIIINESGLYSIILRSDKPQAKQFKKWVTAEVLPSIRKTGGYHGKIPAFIRRFNENWDRVSPGHFSVISELVIRLYGRLEMVGHTMADKAKSGQELRPDVSVGKVLADWLRKRHPDQAGNFSMYVHKTPEGEFPARQYPIELLPLYIEFIDTVWLPEYAETYFRTRDPVALQYLPKLLPMTHRAKPVIAPNSANKAALPSKKKSA